MNFSGKFKSWAVGVDSKVAILGKKQVVEMISSGTNLVMTVIGFAVSTMFIVFVCTRLICARIQLNARRRSFAYASRSDLSIVSTCFITGLVVWCFLFFIYSFSILLLFLYAVFLLGFSTSNLAS